jgi:hypothetical protein
MNRSKTPQQLSSSGSAGKGSRSGARTGHDHRFNLSTLAPRTTHIDLSGGAYEHLHPSSPGQLMQLQSDEKRRYRVTHT